MRGSRLVGVGLLLVTTACGIGPFGGGSSSGGSEDKTALEAEYAIVDGFCDGMERCKDVRGPTFSSLSACKDYYRSMFALSATFSGQTAEQMYNNTYNVDQGKLDACLSYIASVACDSTAEDHSCDGVLAPKHALAVGQACTGGLNKDQLCGLDAYCETKPDNADCKVCRALKANGSGCESGDECQSGYCNPASPSTCGSPPASARKKGESCSYDTDCLGSLDCAGSGSQTCQELLGVNSECDTSGHSRPGCLADLWCMPGTTQGKGTCVAPLADGATCQRHPGGNVCKNFCVFATKDAAEGQCQTLSAMPVDGQPCVDYAGYGALFCSQDDSVYANLGLDISTYQINSCECRATVNEGSPCTLNSACKNGRCDGANWSVSPPTPGTCGARFDAGHACASDSDCVSNICTGSSGNKTCGATLSCP